MDEPRRTIESAARSHAVAAASSRPAAKFEVPRVPAGMVTRRRLLDLLDRGAAGALTLVAAPAGAGKTALLGSWVRAGRAPGPVAWIGLQPGDNHRRRFWTAILAALARTGTGGSLETLAVPPRASIDPTLRALADRLAGLEGPIVLVLDDLHEVNDPQVMADLDALLEHPPDGLRLVLCTRADPAVRLHRLRLDGRITEIRATQLACTQAEAADLLHRQGVTLGAQDLRSLWRQTEGWMAALRLAALALRDHPDPQRFVAEFTGDGATVAGYLMMEVLARQPPDLRRFLLETSLLDVFNGDLAGAVTDRADAHLLLSRLERSGALLTAVDGRRSWYRYHHLFADLLRAELCHERPGEMTALHRRAARWLDEHGYPVEAARHALEAKDWDLAARLLADRWIALMLQGELGTVRALLAGLPPDVVDREPELAVVEAATRIEAGDDAGAQAYLREASAPATVAAERRPRLAVAVAAVGLYSGRMRGDLDEALAAARRLLAAHGDDLGDYAGEADLRTLALTNLGIVETWTGDLGAAEHHLERGMAAAVEAGHHYHVLLCTAHLAVLDAFRCRLSRAAQRSEGAIDLAGQLGWTATPAAAAAYGVLGGVLYHWNDLAGASLMLQRAAEATAGSQERPLHALVAINRVRLLGALDQLDAALAVLHAAVDELGDWPAFTPVRGLFVAQEGLLRAGLGEYEAGRKLLEAAYAEHPYAEVGVALARLLLVTGEHEAALRVTTPHLEQAAGLVSTTVEAHVVAALAHETADDPPSSAKALERALDLAERPGLRRVFIQQGAPMRALLRRQLRGGTRHPSLVRDLLDAMEVPAESGRERLNIVLKPLSDREKVVLRYLATLMSVREISAELYVSTNTLKTHVKSIYRKLGVADRREAVGRGRELGILAPQREPSGLP